MKKILILSLILSSIIFADKVKIPMPASSLSVENSGLLNAIDVYQDGVGIYTLETLDGTSMNNEDMNKYVYKYGAEAKKLNLTLKEVISNNETLKVNIEKFEPMLIAEGERCNDLNNETINDTYKNGVCIGELEQIASINNGTVKCGNIPVGESFIIDNVSYLVVDNVTIKNNLNRTDTICTSHVTKMNSLFQSNRTYFILVSSWDTSNVTNMALLFYNIQNYTLNIGNWDTSKVTNMGYMFYHSTNFDEDLSKWDVSKVTNMGSMFSTSTGSGEVTYMKFNNGGKPLTWTTSSLEDMSYMFGIASFNQYIGDWDTSKVTNMYGLFSAGKFNNGAGSGNDAPPLKWDTSNVTNMDGLVNNNRAFNVDLSRWCATKASKNGISTAAYSWSTKNRFGYTCYTDYIK